MGLHGPGRGGLELPRLEWMLVPPSHIYVHKRFQHCNYLQNVKGEVDSSHVSFLHREFRPEKFNAAIAGQTLLVQTKIQRPNFSSGRLTADWQLTLDATGTRIIITGG